MYLDNIDYYHPTNLKEVLTLLDQYQNKANILAGGTDLILQMKIKRRNPSCLIDIKGVKELENITIDEKKLTVGCGVSLTQLLETSIVKEEFPALWDSIYMHADRQIRNRGTLIGNLCNASPAAETSPPLLSYNAVVEIQSVSGTREVALQDFFVGPGKTVLNDNEFVTKVHIPIPPENSVCSFQKLSRVYDDIATINASARLEFDHDDRCISASIYMGAVGPTTRKAVRAEKNLLHKTLSDEVIKNTVQLAVQEASPISDVRASAEYRKNTIGVLVKRALKNIQENHKALKAEV